MNPFVVVVDLRGAPVGADVLSPSVPALLRGDGRLELLWRDCWAGAWVPSARVGRPAISHREGVTAVGDVRLTAGADAARSADGPARARTRSDLDLLVDHYLRRGHAFVRDLVGDFAFVLWDARWRTLVAARDALGVKTLFYRQRGHRLIVASHLECLEPSTLDATFIGHFLLGHPSATTHTIDADVTRLAAGSRLVARDRRVSVERYWDATEFPPLESPPDEVEAATRFRGLLREAVAAHLDDGPRAWAQLSGGLDSSSVVATASVLARDGVIPRPLEGSVTIVDSLSDGDETRFSNPVVERYGLRNERIVDCWAWQGDGADPPLPGEPRHFLPFFARDREMARIAREAGATVLVSGIGPDHYLTGPDDYIADLIASRRWGEAARRLTEMAIAYRRSFWKLGFRHGIVPLLPHRLRRRWRAADERVPAWLAPERLATEDLDRRLLRQDLTPSGRGVFADHVRTAVGCLDLALGEARMERGMETRFPFLHRPLVEFGLRLPAGLLARPRQEKWILRRAMGDLLPDVVRTRTGKGGIDGRIVWSLNRERRLLERMVADSHLAELGWVRREVLSRALGEARAGRMPGLVHLFATLSLETWLAIKSGWWARYAGALLTQGREATGRRAGKEGDHVVEAAVQ